MRVLKLEGKQTDIFRLFILQDDKYVEIKRIRDKEGDLKSNIKLSKRMSGYQLEDYLFKLKQKGYIEVN